MVGSLDITEAGTQKRLAIHLVHDPEQVDGIARLGPDVTRDDFTAATFAEIVSQAGRRQVKSLLRDQSAMCGIGNAYSDEILFAAKMSPTTPASSLTPKQVGGLFDAIRMTLAAATQTAIVKDDLRKLKDGKRANMKVHGRAGKPCPRCGATVLEVSSADSAYQYCPDCQTRGKPLANRRMSRLLR